MISSSQYSIGEILNVVLRYGDEQFPGRASVQSVRELGPTISRYGLHLISDREGSETLTEGLKNLAMETQRRQLARAR